MKIRMPNQWVSVWHTVADYWRLYGGWKGLVCSPYLAIAAFISLIFYPAWAFTKIEWVQSAMDILPGLLGFSIGAFAVILVFSNDRMVEVIAEEGSQESMLMRTSAMFVHFILTQVVALLAALACKIYAPLAGIGFFLLIYALLLAIATCFALFNLAQVYNAVLGTKTERPRE